MARIIITAANSPPHTLKVPQPHKVVRHGAPRWGYAFRRGKGGQEVRPPYMIAGSRMPDVSLEEDNYARAKRRALLNLVADAALRHDMPIPDAPRFVAMTVAQHKEQLRKELRIMERREEAVTEENERRAQVRRQVAIAKASNNLPVLCGRCSKLIVGLTKWEWYKAHSEDCLFRAVLWQEMCQDNPDWQRAWKLRKEMTRPTVETAPADVEDSKTKTQLQDEFNASDMAIAVNNERGAPSLTGRAD